MARKKLTAVAETEIPLETTNEGTTMTEVQLDMNDALPLEIPEGDIKSVFFKHSSVRAVMVNPKVIKGTEKDWWNREGKDTYAYQCDFMLRDDQPDHPELADLAGMRLGFNRFPIVPGNQSQEIYLAICRSYGVDPRNPGAKLADLDSVAVILKLDSKAEDDKETGEPTGRIFHRVNKVLRDLEYEKAHGGGQ